MRRRLDVAASLVQKPPVLFLDEPTTGLDLQSRQELWKTIRNLVQEGTTVILTTQYLEEADQLADDLVVIDHGRIIAQGTAGELKRNLGGTVIELTMGDGSDVDKAVSLVGAVTGTEPERQGTLLRMPSPDGSHLLTQMLRRLDDEGVQPTSVALREPSLDDVFLALTGHAAEQDQSPENGQGDNQTNGQGKGKRS
jgi:ABC-2 type transport system ATP-binding protein